jgi:hypothetical protein
MLTKDKKLQGKKISICPVSKRSLSIHMGKIGTSDRGNAVTKAKGAGKLRVLKNIHGQSREVLRILCGVEK